MLAAACRKPACGLTIICPCFAGQDIQVPQQAARSALQTVQLFVCHKGGQSAAAGSSSAHDPHMLSLDMRTGVVSMRAWGPGEQHKIGADRALPGW